MFRNLIFDWSGTLVDDLDLVIDATNTVFTHYGREALSKDEFKKIFRLPYPDFYTDYIPEAPIDELENVFRHGFDISTSHVHILPHAYNFMNFCKEAGIRCFALTSVDPPSFYIQAKEVGLEKFFEHCYPGAINKKEYIHNLLEKHDLKASETGYIGDMTHDVETAAHAGVTSIAVLTGYQNAQQLAASHPDIIIPNLSILKKLMEQKKQQVSLPPQDTISINGLKLNTYIGVPDEERADMQTVKAHITLTLPKSLGGLDDDIERTVNYADMVILLEEEALRTPRKLIETLAEDCAQALLNTGKILQAQVCIEKFILPQTDSVTVTVTLPRA